MKHILLIFICCLLLSACKKNDDDNYIPGKIVTQVNYKGSIDNSVLKNSYLKETVPNSLYTRFGDYVTSLTPKVFKAKFHCIRYVDELNVFNQIELLNNNLPGMDPLRYADFTNNSTVSMEPTLNGALGNDGASFTNTIEFKYFYFRINYFYQEIQLPEQYNSIETLDQFHFANVYEDNENIQFWCTRANNLLSARYRLFMIPLYEHAQRAPDAFVFGGTDSSYILNLFTQPHDFPNNLPYDGDYIIRSKNYIAIKYIPAQSSNKSTLINATIKFDYNNLIQIYAGPDNIPYTKDDVFVYEPNYYNRLTVDVIIQ